MKLTIISILLMAITLTSCSDNSGKKAVYEGEDITGFAEIIRDKQTKQAFIQINQSGEWKLYAGSSVDEIDWSKPISSGSNTGTFPLNVSELSRSYFQLVTDKGKAILAERHLPMTGGFNFRDLGGVKTTEGRYVKWGKIFRSDDLYTLTDDDLAYLESIPLISIVDFRSADEIKASPDRIPSTVREDYAYMITPGNLTASSMDISQLAHMNMDSVMIHINELLVTDSASITRYKDFFALLQNESDVPLLFHCSAGKDRTGMGAALVLFALGVDEETILNDYLASNIYLADKYGKLVTEYPELKPLFGVSKEFLQAGIKRIKEDHGTVEGFLINQLDVDIEKFKEMYLY